MRLLLIAVALTALAGPAFAQDADAPLELPPVVMSTEHPGEIAVDPYDVSDANAGGTPFAGDAMYDAFHGEAGIGRIVDGMLDRSVEDPRTAGIFAAADLVRLRRTLREQFSYLLGGPSHYTGRDMETVHRNLGLQSADMGALVEHLQLAMNAEHIPFATQNRFLAKLAPMKPDVVTR